MAETATPILPFDEAAALEWLRAQPGARTNLPAAELARRWGWNRQRAGRRIKAWTKAGLVKRRGKTVIVTNGRPPKALHNSGTSRNQSDPTAEARVSVTLSTAALQALPGAPVVTPPITVPEPVPVASLVSHPFTAGGHVMAYTAAFALAGAAAWFSVRGMIVLFPAAPLSVMAMATAMEVAKLVTAGWLARRWRATAWIWRLILLVLVAGLAVINAAGVYAQLVAAHVGERGAAHSAIETQDAALAARIEVAASRVADLDRQIAQIDAAVSVATQRGKASTAVSVMEGQRKSRGALAGERQESAAALAALKAERASVAAVGRQIETDAAPILYVAELLGIGTDSEKAIRWLIALIVLCCDPLAIALTAAASAQKPA